MGAGVSPRPTLVGVVGRKGAGKDTIVDRLASRHGYVRAAFADNVKAVARRLFPHLSTEQLWGRIELKEALDLRLG